MLRTCDEIRHYLKLMKKDFPLFVSVTRQMKREVAIHLNLRHANIVILLGTIFEDENYGIVLEFVEYGSLETFLNGTIKRIGWQ